MFRWVKNTKLSSFMDAYHAPYKPKYRYWTGLLLFIRISLNIAKTANISGNPQNELLTILILTGLLLLLKANLGDSVYKTSFLDYFESTSYFNLLIFSLASFYSVGKQQSQKTAAYVSISITFVMTLCALFYHIHYTLSEVRWYRRLCDTIKSRIQTKGHDTTNTLHSMVSVRIPSRTDVSLSDLLKCSMEDMKGQDKHKLSITNTDDPDHLREPLLQ